MCGYNSLSHSHSHALPCLLAMIVRSNVQLAVTAETPFREAVENSVYLHIFERCCWGCCCCFCGLCYLYCIALIQTGCIYAFVFHSIAVYDNITEYANIFWMVFYVNDLVNLCAGYLGLSLKLFWQIIYISWLMWASVGLN